MNLTSSYLKKLISDKAKELGFVQVGFSKVEILDKESSYLREWLNNGYAADMNWIEKGFDKRKDIRLIMADAKSVISLAYNYYTPIEHDENLPKISRYAWGKDYHKILKKKLKELCEEISHCEEQCDDTTSPFLERGVGGFEGKSDENKSPSIPLLKGGLMMKYYVDDGPVMDKVWAVKAGIGAMGKHTNIINTSYGSWIFLCNIITNIEFDSYDSPIEDLCGGCTLCISACPTGAIIDEYKVDANKCISYQTIENRGEIPDSINLDGWIFGCDVCQDVCPYNSPKYNQPTNDLNFYPKKELMSKTPQPPFLKEGTKDIEEQTPLNPPFNQRGEERSSGGFKNTNELNAITEEEFNIIFADSPVKRTKFKGWKRNLEKL